MGKSHFEDCISDAELVILCNADYFHVPSNDQDEGKEEAKEDVDDRVEGVGFVVRKTSWMSRA